MCAAYLRVNLLPADLYLFVCVGVHAPTSMPQQEEKQKESWIWLILFASFSPDLSVLCFHTGQQSGCACWLNCAFGMSVWALKLRFGAIDESYLFQHVLKCLTGLKFLLHAVLLLLPV